MLEQPGAQPVFAPGAALLIIDMLNDFVREGAPLRVPLAEAIIPTIQCARGSAYAAGVPVIYLCDNHRPDDPEFRTWGTHAVAGSEGARVVEELAPGPGDVVIPKRRFSGFFGTDLDLHLRERGVKRVVLTGTLTDICVYHTAVDAAQHGYEVTVLRDAVAALSPQQHRFALQQMQRLLGARLATTGQ